MALATMPLVMAEDPIDFAAGCAALSYLSACLCFALAWLDLPPNANLELIVERTVWGGGHVLQLVNCLMLMSAWLRLSRHRQGGSPVSAPIAKACFAALTAFALCAPLIYAISDADDLPHRQAFTRLLWIGLPLPPAIFGVGLLRSLWRAKPNFTKDLDMALVLSLAVFFVGGMAGFFLGVGDTRTPSHYHAVIGGVNLGLMALFPMAVLPRLGLQSAFSCWPFALYGGGQLLHALGFFTAGLAGVPRKSAGLAQGLDSWEKIISMAVVGLGGTVAVIGGVWFIGAALKALLKKTPTGPVDAQDPSLEQSGGNGLSLAILAVSVFLVGHWLAQPLTELSEPSLLDRAAFQIKMADMIRDSDTRQTVDGRALIHPTGQDIYLAFRQWSIEPPLLLDANKSYRIHAMAYDVVHSIALMGNEALLIPNQESVLVMTMPELPQIEVQCAEFCGNGHARMSAKIEIVTESK